VAFRSLIEPPEELRDTPGLWFCVERSAVLVHADAGPLRLPQARHPRQLGIEVDHEHFLGVLDGVPVWAAGIDRELPGECGLRPEPLFGLFSHVPEHVWMLAGRAVQIADWHRTHQFCGRCGSPTEPATGERARRCGAC
jgi:NAD+ diphosphatase